MKRLKVYSGGSFEVPHGGHVNFFQWVKKVFPDCYFILALNTDEFIEKYKGFRPAFSFDERKRFLENINLIDKVVENFGGADSRLTILKYKPDVIVIGQDWLAKDYCKQMGFTPQWLTDNKITLVYVPHTDGISTTEIKKRLKK